MYLAVAFVFAYYYYFYFTENKVKAICDAKM